MRSFLTASMMVLAACASGNAQADVVSSPLPSGPGGSAAPAARGTLTFRSFAVPDLEWRSAEAGARATLPPDSPVPLLAQPAAADPSAAWAAAELWTPGSDKQNQVTKNQGGLADSFDKATEAPVTLVPVPTASVLGAIGLGAVLLLRRARV